MCKKVFMFFVVMSVSLLIVGCGSKGELVDLTDKSDLYVDAFSNEEDEYFLYFFMDTCGHCQAIADDIRDYKTNGAIKLYKLNFTEEKYETWDEFGVEGTPTLFHVIKIDGETYIKKRVSGSKAVVDYLDKN